MAAATAGGVKNDTVFFNKGGCTEAAAAGWS